MALSIVLQPDLNGYYTAYLPIKLTVTGSTDDFISFDFLDSSSNPIDIPIFKVPNIGGNYTLDLSRILANYLNVRHEDGMLGNIQVLTNNFIYLKVRATDSTSNISSNLFYTFAFLDNVKSYASEQTAKYPIVTRFFLNNAGGSMYENNYNYLDNWSMLSWFVTDIYYDYVLTTYSDNNFTNVLQTAIYTFPVSQRNKLISFGLNKQFLASLGFTNTNYQSFTIRTNSDGVYSISRWKTINNISCKKYSFVFINKWGVKENITFFSNENTNFKTTSSEFISNGFNHIPSNNTIQYQFTDVYFNTSGFKEKISQTFEEQQTIESINLIDEEKIKDFLASPIHWQISQIENLGRRNAQRVQISDGDYTLRKDNRLSKVSFKVKLATQQLSFK